MVKTHKCLKCGKTYKTKNDQKRETQTMYNHRTKCNPEATNYFEAWKTISHTFDVEIKTLA